MPDITTFVTYAVKFSEREWRLVMKALAHMGGLKVARPTPEDMAAARELNTTLLAQRKAVLEEQLKIAEGAYGRAKEAEHEHPGVSDPGATGV